LIRAAVAHAENMMHTRTNAPGAWFNKMLLLALLIAPFALASSSGLDLSGQAHAPFHFKRQINGTIAPTCPDGNGTTYISNGQNFTIECGFDRAAGPLNSIGSAGASDGVVDLQTCIDKCAATAECVDVSYVEGGGSCYLKSDVAWANYADNIFGARLTAQPYNQTLICPASNGTTFDTTAGYPYIVECSIDRSTGYITTANTVGLDDCLARCDITPGCIDVSWDPDTPTGTCYLKKAIDNPKTSIYCQIRISSYHAYGDQILAFGELDSLEHARLLLAPPAAMLSKQPRPQWRLLAARYPLPRRLLLLLPIIPQLFLHVLIQTALFTAHIIMRHSVSDSLTRKLSSVLTST